MAEQHVVRVRVMIEHSPTFIAMLGLIDVRELSPVLNLKDSEGVAHTFYRAKSNDRWVLYRAAVQGHGENTFDRAQR